MRRLTKKALTALKKHYTSKEISAVVSLTATS